MTDTDGQSEQWKRLLETRDTTSPETALSAVIAAYNEWACGDENKIDTLMRIGDALRPYAESSGITLDRPPYVW